jgi:cytosine/uracil/thiamine/allantoin permease
VGEIASHFFEFLWAVGVNWRTVIAAVVFGLFSFPNAALSDEGRAYFDARWPPEFRRKWFVGIALGYVFIACFLAWNEQRNRTIEIQGQESTLEQRG